MMIPLEDAFVAQLEPLRHVTLPSAFQQIIHQSKYARWLDKEQRRETWFETVLRYVLFFRKRFGTKVPDELWVETFKSILNLEVFPSMRALWSAGKALEKDEVCNYNCSYVAVNTPRAFSEAFYLLLCGCFHKDQEVQTLKGNKKICEITTDDKVLTFDEETNSCYFTNPVAIFENEVSEIPKIKLSFSDGSSIVCTETHEFLTERGWIQAKESKNGDFFDEELTLVQKETFETEETHFWDMTIENTHNYILSNGIIAHNCGVGFSVERQEISKLPEIPDELFPSDTVIVVKDSKLGWVQSLNELISLLYTGRIPKWDLSLIRPTGSRLKTFGGRACLSGDTVVYKDRPTTRGKNEITIKQLFDMKHSQGFWEHKSNHFKDVKLRSLDEEEGVFFRNNLLDVIDNGISAVYEIVTENGYRIKATDNHRFMTESGEYSFLSDFSVGDYIAVNGSDHPRPKNCLDCDTPISKKAQRCKQCVDKKQTIFGSRNNQFETYRKNRKDSCECCQHDGTKSELQVHHKDGNRWNNELNNWMTLCEGCHRKLHFKEWTFGNPYSHRYVSFDKIISIEYAGVEQVYDLVMQGPNHNFVANGFVSHNSGPRPLHDLFTSFINTFKNAKGRKLTSFECHCLMTDIAATVQVGGSRRCCFSDTLIETETGEQIKLKDVKVGMNIKSGDGSITTITNIFDNGIQEVVKVHLEDNTFFECTDNHRWLVLNEETSSTEFVEARDLIQDKYSLVREMNPNLIISQKIIDVEYTHEQKPVMDIEVSHPDHYFLAISPNGATAISHNSALISLSNLSDERMRDCKSGKWWEQYPNLSFANNSVAYTEKPDIGIFMKEWLALYMSKSGERGIFNRQGAKNHIKKEGKRDWNHEWALNPCLTGDTLVAVADGRNVVSIKQLSEEGKDVPVYCLDDNQELTISMMVNPRLTGRNFPIFEVTIENGHKIRTTGNHKVLTRNQGYVEVQNLQEGDSLLITSKSLEKNNKHSGEYYWLFRLNGDLKKEHQLISSYLYGETPKGFLVHHKDHNSLNNSWDNLEVVSLDEHNRIHGFYDTEGENNGRFVPVSKEELQSHFDQLTKEKGYRITSKEWCVYAKEKGLPQHLNHFRGGIRTYISQACKNVNVEEYPNVDLRTLNCFKQSLQEGYDCELIEDKILYHKICEFSGEPFDTFVKEQMVKPGYGHLYSYQKNKEEIRRKTEETRKQTIQKRLDGVKIQQISIWRKLYEFLGRIPLKQEWANECKQEGVSSRICNDKTTFRYYEDLKACAIGWNHKVISVKQVGTEDVYNGTVETYHNFFIGGFGERTLKGKSKKLLFINNLQCGEVILKNRGLCNLSSTIVRPEDTFETLKSKLTFATFLGTIQSDMTNFRFLSKEWKKNCLEEHLLGVSLTGIMDHPFLSGKVKTQEGFPDDLPTTLRLLKEHIYQENERFAGLLEISPSVSVTVVKPEGNSSSLNNTSPGIHPRFSPFYIRSVRFDNHDPLAKMLSAQGVRNEPDVMKPETTTVFYFPIKSPNHAVFVKDVSAIEQLELYKVYKENYTSHNPSITVYVKEHEWMEVGAWVYKNFDLLSGVSFLPNIEHNYTQLPYQEVTEEEYLDELSRFPKIAWDSLHAFEQEDNTTGGQEYACLGGACLLD